MKRDPDLIRDLLLAIEADPKYDGAEIHAPELSFGLSGHSAEEIGYHLKMLVENRYVNGKATALHGQYVVYGLTMKGHDYLDSIRDPEIWRQTKEGAMKGGGFTLSLLGDLAKGFIKTKIKEQTGIDV